MTNNKTLVLLSGGMDSSTAVGWAKRNSDLVEAVSFNYGQRHSKEIQAAKQVAEHYDVDHTILDLRGAAEAFRGSALTSDINVPEGHYADETMKLTVVPNRNMIMLSLAAGLAISRKMGRIVYAAHAGDHAIYPDCRPEFAALVGACIRIGNYEPPELQTPFIMHSKADIARIGNDMGVPFDLTWSCYKGRMFHCGNCGTCVERKEAFELAGVTDPTKYEAY
jgi:7-cyano-7-deazaguanine synthase